MSKRSRPARQPTTLGRRGQRGSWDPFYQFERLARDHGEPPKPRKPPKGELLLMGLLSSKGMVMVMGCILAVAALALLVLLVFKG